MCNVQSSKELINYESSWKPYIPDKLHERFDRKNEMVYKSCDYKYVYHSAYYSLTIDRLGFSLEEEMADPITINFFVVLCRKTHPVSVFLELNLCLSSR
jgi:uncharacterized protein YdiU (UPF0061 family)